MQAAASSNSCLTADVETLYANQDELGANFGRLTANEKAGRKLATVLREHIRIAIEIVTAAIAGQPTDTLYAEWQANAVAISRVYAKYDPNISFEKINALFQEHLASTLAEAVAIIQGKCKKSVVLGDAALAHIRVMADYLNSKF